MAAASNHKPRLYLSPPHLDGPERDLVAQAFDLNFIAPAGPHLARLEEAFQKYTGTPHCVALVSGTAGLHLALRVLGLGPGDLVLASSLTFIASVAPVAQMGADLVFVDSERTSWNMDPDLLLEALETLAREGRPARAVVVTDLYGQCADYARIQAACEQYGAELLCDAAEAVGATCLDRAAGSFGRAGIYSLNGNKIITTGGGGLLLSHDQDLADKARWLSQQARDPAPHYEHSVLGHSYRLSNVLAAIGLGQLAVLDKRVARRREIFEFYQNALGDLPGLSFMPEAPWGRSNRWLTVLQLDPTEARTTPEALRLALETENIESRPLWKPMHLQPVFAGKRMFGGAVGEELFARGLCLPSGTALDETDLERVVRVVRDLAG